MNDEAWLVDQKIAILAQKAIDAMRSSDVIFAKDTEDTIMFKYNTNVTVRVTCKDQALHAFQLQLAQYGYPGPPPPRHQLQHAPAPQFVYTGNVEIGRSEKVTHKMDPKDAETIWKGWEQRKNNLAQQAALKKKQRALEEATHEAYAPPQVEEPRMSERPWHLIGFGAGALLAIILVMLFG